MVARCSHRLGKRSLRHCRRQKLSKQSMHSPGAMRTSPWLSKWTTTHGARPRKCAPRGNRFSERMSVLARVNAARQPARVHSAALSVPHRCVSCHMRGRRKDRVFTTVCACVCVRESTESRACISASEASGIMRPRCARTDAKASVAACL
eukprot:5458231-Pyramimonas_sp.AAC.1